MKKIVVLSVMFLFSVISFSSFAQSNSTLKLIKELNKGREKEIALVEKRFKNAFEPGVEDKKTKEIEAINARYDKLVETALSSQQVEKVEQPQIEEKRTRKFLGGANVEVQGDQGNFSGRTANIERGSNAYATVVLADANATLIKSLSRNGNVVSASSIGNTGLEGVVANRNRYGEMKIVIEGVSSGNNFKKTYLLNSNQSVTDYLLPGRYRAIIKQNGRTPLIEEFDVLGSSNMTDNYEGRPVFWAVWGGSRN